LTKELSREIVVSFAFIQKLIVGLNHHNTVFNVAYNFNVYNQMTKNKLFLISFVYLLSLRKSVNYDLFQAFKLKIKHLNNLVHN